MLILYFIIAFIGGVISLFSPCSGALLPTYFAISFKNRILLSNLIFALGVFTVSYPLIIGASYVFNLTQDLGPIIFQIIGLLFLLFAILTFFSNVLKVKGYEFNFLNTSQNGGLKLVYFAGIVSGLTLTSCVGPILGAIITLSSTTNNTFISVLLVLTYILGMVFPLFLISSKVFKLDFLKTIFTKGKLFCINIQNYKFYVHSTNILLTVIFLFLAWLYYFHQGSISSVKLFSNSYLTNLLFEIQYQFLKLLTR